MSSVTLMLEKKMVKYHKKLKKEGRNENIWGLLCNSPVCLSVSVPSGCGPSSDECSPLGGHFVLMEGEGQGCSRCRCMIYL